MPLYAWRGAPKVVWYGIGEIRNKVKTVVGGGDAGLL